MAESTNSLVAFSDQAAQLVERPAVASSLFTVVAEDPRAASIGVLESSSPLKRFWSWTGTSRLRFPVGG